MRVPITYDRVMPILLAALLACVAKIPEVAVPEAAPEAESGAENDVADADETETDTDTDTETAAEGADETALTPEQMERIDSALRRRLPALNRCYERELEKRDKQFKGDVLVNIQIDAAGHAVGVEIANDSLKSPEVIACLTERIKGINFGELASDFYYPFSFHFEPAF